MTTNLRQSINNPLWRQIQKLVIGGTGAQGLAVIDKLLAPAGDDSSPYAVRVVTRDP
ncbi:hypothetical protein DAEQUDRAFT_728393 [Daedalea quercina L-15889]|uniref:NmrA-like domain-containing protein n=1 Tax=Daedalea quercina L-15889 TaxID=1314783 RepID=A0A165P8S4_9APHY|nr:hypothetical protein DAEQUDRAFT_728393 [Daedalea quercina L-15889]